MRFLANKNLWAWLLAVASLVFLVTYCLYFTLTALQAGIWMDTYAANGTFQLYNPLRRLADGQVLGYDFPFFHGIGVVLIHFPLFELLGGNVFAAEVTKHVVSPTLFILSAFVFFYAFFRNALKAIIATGLATIACLLYVYIIGPGNSLMSVRSTLPILVAAAMVWQTKRTLRIGKYKLPINDLVAVLILGVSVTTGTEHGLAAIAAYLLVRLAILLKARRQVLRGLIKVAITGMAIVAVIILSLTIMTLGHPISAIEYAFLEVPSDQGWYFGAAPNPTLTWQTLIPQLIVAPVVIIIPSIAVVAILVANLVTPLPGRYKQTFLYMFLAGLIVAIVGGLGGYYDPASQLIPLDRLSVLMIVALAIYIVFDKARSKSRSRTVSVINWILFVISVSAIILFTVNMISNTIRSAKYIQQEPVKSILEAARLDRKADDYTAASPSWKQALNEFLPKIPTDATVWSTYTSLYDSQLGKMNPSSGGEDYIIHALGEDRREQYAEDFLAYKADYVITLRPDYFPYEEWLWDRQWGVYKEIFTNYKLIAKNNSHFLWQRQANSQEEPLPWQSADNIKGLEITNNDSAIALYEVELDYTTKTMAPFSKMPRYTITIKGTDTTHSTVSLPNYETSWKFPVALVPGESATLVSRVDSIIPSDLNIHSLKYRRINVLPENNLVFASNRCLMQARINVQYNACVEELYPVSTQSGLK